MIVIPLVVLAALAAPAYVTNRVNQVHLQVECDSAKANISQLSALREISEKLGIPVTFKVPSLPLECR